MSNSRIFAGTVANLYGQGVTIATQLLGVPVLISAWGLSGFGLWSLLIAVPALLITMDFGYGAAAAAMMSKSAARNDYRDTLESLHSAFAVVTGIVVGIFLLAFVIWLWAAHRTPFALGGLTAEDVRIASKMLPFFIAYVGVTINSGLINAVWRVNGRYTLGVLIYETGRLIEQSLIIITAWLGGSLIAASIMMLCSRVLFTLVSTAAMIRCTPWVSINYSHCSRSRMKELFRPAMGAMFIPICILAGIQGVTFGVGVFLTPAVAGSFATIRVLYRMAVQVVGALTRATVPDFSIIFSKMDRESYEKITRFTFSLLLSAAFLGPVGIVVFGPWFINIWTHGRVKIDFLIYAIMAIHAFFACVWNGLSNLLTGLNFQNRFVPQLVVWNMIILLSLIITLPRYGLVAAAISLAAIDILSFVSVWIVWHRATADFRGCPKVIDQHSIGIQNLAISEAEFTDVP